jgi:hypothetical protein
MTGQPSLRLTNGSYIKQSVEATKQMCGLFNKSISLSNPIHLVNRRSFYAVGQSCVINLNPTQSQSGDTPSLLIRSPLNLVTLLAPCSVVAMTRRHLPHQACVYYQAVGRGETMEKNNE